MGRKPAFREGSRKKKRAVPETTKPYFFFWNPNEWKNDLPELFLLQHLLNCRALVDFLVCSALHSSVIEVEWTSWSVTGRSPFFLCLVVRNKRNCKCWAATWDSGSAYASHCPLCPRWPCALRKIPPQGSPLSPASHSPLCPKEPD